MAGLKRVKFSISSWAGLDPPDTPPDSPEGPLSPETKLLVNGAASHPAALTRSASYTAVDKANAQRPEPVAQADAEGRNNSLPARGSEDSGLGTNSNFNNSPHHLRPPALHLDIQHVPVSRTSSFVGSCNSVPATPTMARKEIYYRIDQSDSDGLVVMLSAVYAKLLVVMGICFPLAEVTSHRIPASYYEAFYLYLYLGSIVFLLYVYMFLLRRDSRKVGKPSRTSTFVNAVFKRVGSLHKSAPSGLEHGTPLKRKVVDDAHCGSFYLRLGAVAFGIGSMIYSGLEFAQFFELEEDSHCYNILYGLTPSSRMAFTFIQLYFIFLNSRMAINRFRTIARFGLMHMIATNMCVWLHVLAQETKHQILNLINPNETNLIPAFVLEAQNLDTVPEGIEEDIVPEKPHHRVERSIDLYVGHECRRVNIMGELVQDASPFLFPCTIEYSLICAAILYVMWKNTGTYRLRANTPDSTEHQDPSATKHRHYYHVDCAKANKGLFTGILVLVLSIICLIIFFVLINKPQYKYLAVLEAHIAELTLYLMTTMAVVIALFQVRELKYSNQQSVELDNILLIVAQSGLYLFTMFSIIGGHFTMDQNTILVLLTAVACIIQATLQTIFILDASRRYANNSVQAHRKPGREMVTFLLVCNFAMWAINTLETRRADSNPVQMNFYGFWAWTIITHVTTPLTIFFRFHSTVCLCDIWKRTYKLKLEYV